MTGPPAQGQPVRFAAGIRPLLRARDRESMSGHFDLGSHADARANADNILDKLAAGAMPCDGAWPESQVELFRHWTQTGMQP
jgi:hypothetical protein